jgi:hypothetical protein
MKELGKIITKFSDGIYKGTAHLIVIITGRKP